MVFAHNEVVAKQLALDAVPDAENLSVEEVSLFVYHDNVAMRGTQSKKGDNFTLDPKDSRWDEFFMFDGVVCAADLEVWHKAAQTMFVWNGKFD